MEIQRQVQGNSLPLNLPWHLLTKFISSLHAFLCCFPYFFLIITFFFNKLRLAPQRSIFFLLSAHLLNPLTWNFTEDSCHIHCLQRTRKKENPQMLLPCVCAKSLQSCPTLCNPIDCNPPGPLSMGFSKQEYWHGLPCPSPGDLPDRDRTHISKVSCTWQVGSLPLGSPQPQAQ